MLLLVSHYLFGMLQAPPLVMAFRPLRVSTALGRPMPVLGSFHDAGSGQFPI